MHRTAPLSPGLRQVYAIAPALVFFGLALLAMYPALIAHPGEIPAVPGGKVSDFYHFYWNYWWIPHALGSGIPVYVTDYVMAPFTSSLALHTLTPFWFPLIALLQPVTGPAVSMNLILACAMAFAGLTTFYLLRLEGALLWVALLAGAFFELSSMFITAAHWMNLNLIGWGWLPLMAIVWRRALAAPSGRGWLWALLLGLCAWALLLIDIQYAVFAPFFLLPYGLFAVWRVARQSPTSFTAAHFAQLGGYALLAGITAVTFLWLAGPLQPLLAFDRSTLSPTPPDRARPIAFPACYLTRCETDVSLGYLLLPLVVLSVIVLLRWSRGKSRRALSPLVWLVFALPPLLITMGTLTPVYAVLHDLLSGTFRYPERFAPVFLLFALLFLAAVWTPILAAHRRWKLTLFVPLFLLVIADSRLFRGFPTAPLPAPYDTYRAMAGDDASYVVVDVPTGAMSGEGLSGDARYPQVQYYALLHNRPVSNGHLSRVDTWHFMYMQTSDPMMAWLGQRRFLEPETVRAQLEERLNTWPVGALALHEDWIDPISLAEVAGFLNAQDDLLCPPTREVIRLPNRDFNTVDGPLLTYRAGWLGCSSDRLPARTATGYTLDWGAPDDVRYLGWGWHPSEPVGGITWRWLGAPPYAGADETAVDTWRDRATLFVDLPPGAYAVNVDVQAFDMPRLLTLTVNGTALGDAQRVTTDGLQTLRFALPAALVGDGQHLELGFVVDATASPADIGLSDDARQLGIALDQVRFEPLVASTDDSSEN